jgi:biopolymer transport protein ExbB
MISEVTSPEAFIESIASILQQGGALMLPLTFLSFAIIFEGIRLWLRILTHPAIQKSQVERVSLFEPLGAFPKSTPKLQDWIQLHVSNRDPKQMHEQLEQLRSHVLKHFQRRAAMLSRFVKAGPLLGLLGTVMGMLGTFQGLLGTGLDRSEDMAAGISQALITTQYGLLVAIPGMMLSALIRSSLQKLNRNFMTLKARAVAPEPQGSISPRSIA